MDVQRQSYPLPPSRIYENIHPPLRYENVDQIGHGVTPKSQVGQGGTPGKNLSKESMSQVSVSPQRNDIMIPQEMRENRAPIHVTVEMKPKNQVGQGAVPMREQNRGAPPRYEPPPHLPPHGYRDQDYGDNWDQETTIMTHQVSCAVGLPTILSLCPPANQTILFQQSGHRSRGREESRVQGQRPPDLKIGEGTTVRGGVVQGTDPRSPGPPPYPRQYPNTPDARGRAGGDDSGQHLFLCVRLET